MRVWADRLLARKAVKYKFKLTAVALANKVARIVFALLTQGGEYNELPAQAEAAKTSARGLAREYRREARRIRG